MKIVFLATKSFLFVKRISSIYILALAIVSCSKEQSLIDTQLKELQISPAAYNQIDTSFYANRAIQSLKLIKNPQEFIQLSFYESGKKKSLGKMVNEQFEGEFIDWYENGNIKWQREFTKGKGRGKNRIYFENGKLEKEFDFASQTLTWYFENGKVREIQKEGEQFELQTFYATGTAFEKLELSADGQENWTYHNEQGSIAFNGKRVNKLMMQQDLPFNGEIKCTFTDGTIAFLAHYKNGLREGKFISCYGDKTKQSEGEYQNGKEISFAYYYPNGQKEYERNASTKKTKRWDSKGNFLGED